MFYIGIKDYASVLPDPVSAIPVIFLLSKAIGHVRDCIYVGLLKWENIGRILLDNFDYNSSNLIIGVYFSLFIP